MIRRCRSVALLQRCLLLYSYMKFKRCACGIGRPGCGTVDEIFVTHAPNVHSGAENELASGAGDVHVSGFEKRFLSSAENVVFLEAESGFVQGPSVISKLLSYAAIYCAGNHYCGC